MKPPGIKHLKLRYDKLPSNFGFNISLGRYTLVSSAAAKYYAAGAYTRPLFDST